MLRRLKNEIKHYYNWWIPNDGFPIIVDSTGVYFRGMILYSSPDDPDPVVFTRHRIPAYDLRFGGVGTFGLNNIITGYIYPLNELKQLHDENAIVIIKGTARKFLADFYDTKNLEENVANENFK